MIHETFIKPHGAINDKNRANINVVGASGSPWEVLTCLLDFNLFSSSKLNSSTVAAFKLKAPDTASQSRRLNAAGSSTPHQFPAATGSANALCDVTTLQTTTNPNKAAALTEL